MWWSCAYIRTTELRTFNRGSVPASFHWWGSSRSVSRYRKKSSSLIKCFCQDVRRKLVRRSLQLLVFACLDGSKKCENFAQFRWILPHTCVQVFPFWDEIKEKSNWGSEWQLVNHRYPIFVHLVTPELNVAVFLPSLQILNASGLSSLSTWARLLVCHPTTARNKTMRLISSSELTVA